MRNIQHRSTVTAHCTTGSETNYLKQANLQVGFIKNRNSFVEEIHLKQNSEARLYFSIINKKRDIVSTFKVQ